MKSLNISDRKGMLLAEETVKIIVALIAITFLVYFLTSLYFSKVKGDKLKFAESDLEEIKKTIGDLEEGESRDYDFFNPRGWSLVGFASSAESKPNSCIGESCICLCDEVFEYGFKDKDLRQAKECSEDGACLIVSDLVEGGFEPIEIDEVPKRIRIGKNEGRISILG